MRMGGREGVRAGAGFKLRHYRAVRGVVGSGSCDYHDLGERAATHDDVPTATAASILICINALRRQKEQPGHVKTAAKPA
jgi:hypothetical protein